MFDSIPNYGEQSLTLIENLNAFIQNAEFEINIFGIGMQQVISEWISGINTRSDLVHDNNFSDIANNVMQLNSILKKHLDTYNPVEININVEGISIRCSTELLIYANHDQLIGHDLLKQDLIGIHKKMTQNTVEHTIKWNETHIKWSGSGGYFGGSPGINNIEDLWRDK